MDGVRWQPLVDGRWPHHFRCRRDAFVGEAARGVLGGQQAANLAGRVLQGGADRVPAIENDGFVVLRAQAVTAGALEPLAPLDLLAGRAGFRSRAGLTWGR